MLARNTFGQDLAVLSIEGTRPEKIVAAGSYSRRAFFLTAPPESAMRSVLLTCSVEQKRSGARTATKRIGNDRENGSRSR
jgi:hypothetical protein